MFITEQNGANMWREMLTENFKVQDQEKLNWVSQYAAIHEIHESQLGVNGSPYMAQGQAGYVPTTPGGVGPMYATPLNTTGMGNVAAPQNPAVGSTQPYANGNLWNQTVGSGDIPVSTLPMALNIALLTIGLQLVPVIPSKGPWHMLSYMDFPYAGGKLGRVNETSFDGKGEGRENKPIYVKVLGDLASLEALRKALLNTKENDQIVVKGTAAGRIDDYSVLENEVATEAAEATLTGRFKGFGRMDGGLLLEVVSCVKSGKPASITEVFAAGKVTVAGVTVSGAKADFVQTSVDLIDGFANFATGKKEAMTRAQNETGTGNTIGLRLFSKWIQMGSYEVTGQVTRQQLQDLPLYGVDAVGKVMEAMQNEITQHINQRILERVFALGVTNAIQQKIFQGLDLNLWLGKGDTNHTLAEFGIKNFTDIHGVDHLATWGDVKNAEVLTSAENLHTRQRRVMSRILAAANIIQTYGRRGRPTWIVTNSQVATALQDVSGYVVAPMANVLAQDGSKDLYMGGTVAGLKVYVDPYMDWQDTRICVGRKGDANSPGVVFLPYILADQVSITAEGTMAPKMLLNSRFAIAELGFYPETQYFTFAVHSEFELY